MRHLSRNAVAYVALFAALCGSALGAGTMLAKNSVGSAQVVDHSLRRVDVARGQAPKGPIGLTGTRGATGLRGAVGPQGPPARTTGASGGLGTTPVSSPSSTYETATVTLPAAGKLLLLAKLDAYAVACSFFCAQTIGLYVDGQPVPNAGYTVPVACDPITLICNGSADGISLSAVVPGLSAGPHQVSFGAGPPVAGGMPVVGKSQLVAVALG